MYLACAEKRWILENDSMFDVDGNDPVEREKLTSRREMGEFLKEYLREEKKDGIWCRRGGVGLG